MLQNEAQNNYFVRIPKAMVNSDGNSQFLFTFIALNRSMDYYCNLSLDMIYKYTNSGTNRTTYNKYINKWKQILLHFRKENIIDFSVDLENINSKEWIYLQTNVDYLNDDNKGFILMNRKEFDKIVKDNSMNLNTKINILQMYYYLRRRMNVVYYSEAEDAGTESRPFYESLNTISENLEISEDTATEHLKLLEKTGLVKKYYTGTYTTLSGQTKNAPNVFIYGYEKNPDTIAERTLTKLREQYNVNNFTFQKTIEDTDVIADTVIGKESVNEESNSTKQDTMIDKKEEDITDENFSLSDDDLPESLKLTKSLLIDPQDN